MRRVDDSLQSSARDLNATSDNRLSGMRFRLCTASEDDQIERLRKRAYLTATNFKLPNPDTVLRRYDPPSAMTVLVSTEQAEVATATYTVAMNRKQAERMLEGPAPLHDDYFPSLILNRGATAPEFRGLGLIPFIASVGVAIAQRAKLRSAMATQLAGAPHFRAMTAAGWDSKVVTQDALRTVASKVDLVLLHINDKQFRESQEHSMDIHAELYRRLKAQSVISQAAEMAVKCTLR